MNDVCLMFVFFLRGSTPQSVSELRLHGAVALNENLSRSFLTRSRSGPHADGDALTRSRGCAGPS